MALRYLFDLDGWQIRHPPPLDKLREVDPRLADLAEQSVARYQAVLKGAGEVEIDSYSAYSGKSIDTLTVSGLMLQWMHSTMA
jgi:hypothetical protein